MRFDPALLVTELPRRRRLTPALRWAVAGLIAAALAAAVLVAGQDYGLGPVVTAEISR